MSQVLAMPYRRSYCLWLLCVLEHLQWLRKNYALTPTALHDLRGDRTDQKGCLKFTPNTYVSRSEQRLREEKYWELLRLRSGISIYPYKWLHVHGNIPTSSPKTFCRSRSSIQCISLSHPCNNRSNNVPYILYGNKVAVICISSLIKTAIVQCVLARSAQYSNRSFEIPGTFAFVSRDTERIAGNPFSPTPKSTITLVSISSASKSIMPKLLASAWLKQLAWAAARSL